MIFPSLRQLRSSPGFIQFTKFSVVGCLNIIVSTIVFYLCYERWHLGSILLEIGNIWSTRVGFESLLQNVKSIDGAIASVAGYVVGMFNSFLLNKIWTFNVSEIRLVHVWRFVVLNLIGIAISTLAIFFLVDMSRMPYIPVWLAIISLVMLLNFLGNKYWTFL